MILESGSITDMFDKAEYTEKMYQYDRDELQKMKDVVTEVTQLGEQLTQEKAELEDMKQASKNSRVLLRRRWIRRKQKLPITKLRLQMYRLRLRNTKT